LKAVAGADHGDAAIEGSAEGRVEALAEFHREDAAAGDVVAVGESAWKTDEIEAVEHRGAGDDGVDVVEFCGCAGKGEAAEHFLVAVGAWGADDEGGGHEGR
jgi:hypothetical protein